MNTRRQQFHVIPFEDGWAVELDGIPGNRLNTKALAIKSARAAAIAVAAAGGLSQVVIHGKHGRIQDEWTYPVESDPRETPG